MQVTMDAIRAAHRRLLPPGSVRTLEDCLAAVERLGLLWPFTPGDESLPSLFPAVATELEGKRWEWVWTWKDRIVAARSAFYGKVAGGKPTLVSHQWLPCLYALTGNTGDMEDDLHQLSQHVRLHELAHKVVNRLREDGPTGTRTLQALLTDGSAEMRKGLDRALEQLDQAMLITKCGNEGGNSIANVWDLFAHFWPEAVEAGTEIATREAALHLLRQVFALTPALPVQRLGKLFPWSEKHQKNGIARLREAGELRECKVEGRPGICRADFLTG